jgi:hypothetical protein
MIAAGSTPTANASPLRTSVAATIAAGPAYEAPSAAPDHLHATPAGRSVLATDWRSLLEGQGRERADAQDRHHDPQRILGRRRAAARRAGRATCLRRVGGVVSRGARAESLAETTRAAFQHAFAIIALLAGVLLGLAAAAAVAFLGRRRAAVRSAKPPTLEPVCVGGEANAAAVAGQGSTNGRLWATKRPVLRGPSRLSAS